MVVHCFDDLIEDKRAEAIEGYEGLEPKAFIPVPYTHKGRFFYMDMALADQVVEGDLSLLDKIIDRMNRQYRIFYMVDGVMVAEFAGGYLVYCLPQRKKGKVVSIKKQEGCYEPGIDDEVAGIRVDNDERNQKVARTAGE